VVLPAAVGLARRTPAGDQVQPAAQLGADALAEGSRQGRTRSPGLGLSTQASVIADQSPPEPRPKPPMAQGRPRASPTNIGWCRGAGSGGPSRQRSAAGSYRPTRSSMRRPSGAIASPPPVTTIPSATQA